MKVTKATSMMTSPPPAGAEGLRHNSTGLTCEPVVLTGMRATMATIWMQMSWKNHCNPMMDQPRM